MRSRVRRAARMVVEELEPRILYSADAAALVHPGALAHSAEVRLLATYAAPADPTLTQRTVDTKDTKDTKDEAGSAASVQTPRREIVFVDTGISGYQQLLADLHNDATRTVEIVLIDARASGIDQISQVLSERQDIAGIHIVSHGIDGAIELGTSKLSAATLSGHAAQIGGWTYALTSHADILIYGCDVAADPQGQALIDALGRLTGADVAASVDLTGSAARGGDWDLEHRTGSIESAYAFGLVSETAWSGTLLATASGAETQVNATTANIQNEAAVAMDTSGNYVVVWTAEGNQDGNGRGVYMRRFDSAGTALGADVRVNAFTTGDQRSASVAMDSSGNYVVVWSSNGQDGAGTGVYGQRYNASGVAQGAEFRVNNTTAGDQNLPHVAMDGSGNFVVAWTTNQGGNVDIYARRYAANGSALGNEFLVNALDATKNQDQPALAIDGSGNFVVAWRSSTTLDGSGTGVFAQRYDAAGSAVGAAFQVNTTGSGNQLKPGVAMNAAGSFVISWTSGNNQDGDKNGVFLQRYNAAGVAQGGEVLVNTETIDNQDTSAVAIDAAGNFTVVWMSNIQDGSNKGIYGQGYDSTGTRVGTELRVNTTTANAQDVPAIAMRASNGDFVVAWQGESATDTSGIAAQRYQSINVAPVNSVPGAQTSLGLPGVIFSASAGNAISISDADGGGQAEQVTLTGTNGVVTLSGTAGLAFTSGDGTSDATMTFSGTIAAINTAMNGLTFAPTPFYSGAASLQILTSDLGNAGAGGTLTDTDTVAINVLQTGTPFVISGSYVGDGVDNRTISGLGFQPDFVIVKSRDNAEGVSRSSTMAGDLSKPMASATVLTADLIQSLTADGFTIGTDDKVNRTGRTFDWIAFKSSASFMTVGTYTGNGAATQSIGGLAFSPEVVFVFDGANQEGVFRTAASSLSFNFRNNNGVASGYIDSLNAAGFTVGTDDRVNKAAQVYHYIAWNEVPGLMDVGSYTGSGVDNRNITGVGFQPEYVLVRSAAGDNAVQHFDSQGAATDSTSLFTANAAATNRIQALQAEGFQLGSDDDVNRNGRAYSYIAWKQETAPTISNIVDQSTNEDVATGAIAFTIGDAETAAGSLLVQATSSNQALIADGSIILGGAGANRTLTLTPSANQFGTATITVRVSDGAAETTDTFVLTVNSVNDAPRGADKTVTTLEDTAYTFTAADFGFTDPNDAPNALLNVRITTLPAAGSLTLLGVAVTPGQFVSAANITAGNLAFTPAANANGAAHAAFTFQVQDDGGTANAGVDLDTAARTMTVDVTAVNDAPMLGGGNNLGGISRNPVANPGTLVADLIFGQVSDPDSGAVAGIAVTAVDNTNGAWELSTDGGSNWAAFGTPSAAVARLLSADLNSYVRFVPNVNFSGTVSDGLTFHAWDQTSGAGGGTANTVPNGGATAFSAAPASVSITVTDTNTAPTLSGANNLTAISEDAAANPGTLVSALIAGQTSDVDPGALSGIAVTAVDNTNGAWEYSLDGGSLWNAFGSPSAANARLLAANADTFVRFVPNADWNGTVTNGLTFRAWDQTSGVAGSTADTTGTSGTFLDQFSVVSYSNNNGTLSWTGPFVENDSSGGGAGGGRFRVAGGALAMQVAVDGNDIYREANISGALSATLSFTYNNSLGASATLHVQASGDGGANYTTLAGGVFDASTNQGTGSKSLDISSFIASNTRIRFLVVSGETGAGSNAFSVDSLQIAATARNGGASAFSTATASSSITVNPVNDDPVITSNGGGALASVNVAENATAVTLVTATDVDLPVQTLTYSIVGGADQALFAIDANTGVLTFVTARDFEAPTDAGANNVYDVTVQAADGSGGIDTQAIAVTVTPVNDNPPLITSNGGGASASLNVAENATAVATVTATDADLPAQTLTYSIVGGADQALFAIDANTGALTFVTGRDFEAPTDAGANNVYDVTVQASDGTLSDTQAIAVTVTSVNDNTPVITSNGGGASAAVNVAENATAVTTVIATDADLPVQTLTYSISGGADAALFAIDVNTGVLTFVAAPDFETPTDAGANNVYDVTVQASDGTLSDTQAIAVTITPVNDNSPAITSNGGGASAAVNVAENATAVTTVTATDADLPAQTLTYSIVGGADQALFAIDTNTGVLTFLTARDFEVPTDAGANNIYDVTVQVSDGTFSDTQAIAVTVTAVNDNTPVITSNGGGASASLNVAENATAVTTVIATDADLPAQTLTYSIVGGADQALFAIDTNTGVLTFVTARDFETPTDAGANNVYDVTVQASDGTLTDTQAIAVTVTPVNDNTPVITSNGGGASASLNVAENATAVTTVVATDADLPAQTLTYSIVGGADQALFAIDANTGALTFVTGRDFETPTDAGANNVYDVTVQASDGTLSDTQAIAVTITPVNDNTPLITSNGGGASAAVNVAENATAVTTVVATDADLPGQTLTYSIVGGADQALFAIDANTGALTFITGRDFETPTDAGANNVYDVTVQASDGTLSDTQAIAVTVTAVNDNNPIITSNGGGASAVVNAAENTTAVTTVTATDADLPAQTLTYAISGGADAARFAIDVNTGVLTFVAAPDFEAPTDAGANNVYDVTVQASDGTLSDTQAIAVIVTPVNDNTPLITSNGGGASAAVNVAENATAVTTVVATDADLPVQTLTYSIVGGADQALFAIDANTGALTFVTGRDFEAPTDAGANNVYDVTVQASDGTLSDTQAIAVTVTSVNDNTPVITSNGGGASAAVNVAENATAVTTVIATDADLPVQTLTYSISGGADAALFAIDVNTGVLTFVAAPDFETPTDAGANNVYDVTVQASDGTLSDTQTIAVTVTPVNDNNPLITSNGGGASAAVNAAENTTAVTTVTATDADLPVQTLTYSIVGGADQALFVIDANTGALTFVTARDFEAPTDAGANNVYDVTVQASDGALSDTQAIAVTITPVDDNSPVIASNGGGASAAVNVAENATAVTTVTATDADLPAQTLTYSISGGADATRFAIDVNTGVLTFVAAPDFETPTDAGANNVYDVTVQAADGSGGLDTQAIAVTITPVNDNSPIITSNGGGASASLNVAENATAVTAVTASDADLPAQTLTYSISGGADAARFAIDVNTGVLTFVAALDFETPTDAGANNVYDVTVQASDGTLSNAQAIAVTVTAVNDNTPLITSNGGGASAAVNVAENATAVTTVVATDADLPALTLTYSIVGGADQALFAIDANTGALSFITAPDFETPTDADANNVYDVTVQASDGTLSDTQAIAVTITPVNDNNPIITSNGGGASAAVNVAENTTAVTTVAATDADLPAQTLTYSISGGADAARFAIDANTGVLTFVVGPDFETPTDAGPNNVYDVTVRASDGTLSDTQAIAVTVTPVNDNNPIITSNGGGVSASVNVAENATAVTTVIATDADLPAQTLTYSIVGGADQALFAIDANTGVLTFVTSRDFEAPTDAGADNVYDVTVQAADGSGGLDTQAITVTVTAVNDNNPIITSNGGGVSASVNVAENATAVTTVVATDADLPAQTLTYSIVGGADQALFAIDANTGALTFVTGRDFETPTDAGANNLYDVTVQASDGTLSDTQAIAVTVTAINDNNPVIGSNGGGASASVNVAENATAVTTVAATDSDLPAQTLTYSISGGVDAALFAIDANTGVLTFITDRDFEVPTDADANSIYDVTVQASDGALTDTQAIAVTVTAVNDNTPVITSNGGAASAAVNVAENATAVTTVTATDADLPAQTLTYSIVGGADQALFAIDANTGVLTFVTARDFEAPTDADANNVYDVMVQASDGTLSDTQAIAVTITPVNDNGPVITSNGGGASAAVNVAENATAVTTVVATDADLPAQALTYSIVGGADQALFAIDANTGALTFVTGRDFETPTDAGANNVYDVTVQASDGTLSDTQAVAVTMTAVNDNNPIIGSNGGGASASVNVAENTTAVTTVVATDIDLPAQTLTYGIVGGADQALFAIDANTGALSFITARDFETPADAGANNIYDVTVQASDGTLSDTQAIAVTVTPVNDNSPIIGSNGGGASAAVNVAENAAAVTTVTATDADLPAQTLTYSISGGVDAALFAIDANTGVLTFVTGRDFEAPTDADANNVYDVTVRASDGALSDTQAIAVTVTPANDNTPLITSSGGGASATVNVAENAAAVITVVATDADLPVQTLTYSIVGGADQALFAIDANTGVLTFITGRDFETPTDAGANNIYDVTVQASDGTLTDTQAIAVTVTAVNDNTPVITSNGGGASAVVNVAENATAVTTVTATDADLPAQTLTYSIVGGADQALFAIDANTGVLTFVTGRDFEAPTDAGANNVYDVTVQASDGTLSDTQAIAVTITPVDDNSPVITSNGGGASAAVNVAENATAVTTVTATDADLPAQTLTYSIVGGADQAWFAIDVNTGTLSFVAAPDFETPTDAGANNVYDVTVQAADGSGGLDTQAIAVTVTPVNDNNPIITSNGGAASASVNVAENATAVTTVVATDADLPAQTLTYSIVGGADQALFAIDANTGILSFITGRDFEAPTDAGANNIYEVTVQASDGALTDTQAIAVTVTSVNDNTPVITSNGGGASAAVNVAENATAVTTVVATDADLPAQTLTYSIVGGADQALFAIDANTGVLTFVTGRDFEVPTDAGADNVYDVTVQTSDGSGGTETQAIAVSVTPVNDNAPVIGVGQNFTLPENSADTTVVGTVVASDADSGTAFSGWTITGGNTGGAFAIDGASGQLTVASSAPLNFELSPIFVLALSVSDGTLTSAVQNVTINLANVNEAPTVANAVSDQSNLEDSAFVFTFAANTFADVDVPDTLTYTSSALPGWLGFNAAARTFSGTPGGADVGTFTVVLTATDSGLAVVSDSFNIVVANINDAPAGADAVVTTLEDTAYSFAAADFGFTDAADSPANALAAVRVNTLPVEGSLTLASAAVSAGQIVTVADIAAGALRFAPAPDASGAPYATFTFQVQDDGGTANGGADRDVTPRTMTIDVAAVNDPPAFIPPPPATPPAQLSSLGETSGGVSSLIAATPASDAASDPGAGSSPAAPAVAPAAGTADAAIAQATFGLDAPAQVNTALPSQSQAREAQGLRRDSSPAASVSISGEVLRMLESSEVSGDQLRSVLLARELPSGIRFAPSSRGSQDAAGESQEQSARQLLTFDNGVRLTGVVISAGAVTWALQGAGLLASLLTSVPAWRHLDPLPVLSSDEEKPEWQDDKNDMDDKEREAQHEEDAASAIWGDAQPDARGRA